MATEVQSGDLNNGSSSRLEVSIDGLTLSPDPEGEQEQVFEPDPVPAEQETEDQSTAEATDDGQEGESAKTTIERKWGFGLLELYGLALKFFKGILYLFVFDANSVMELTLWFGITWCG